MDIYDLAIKLSLVNGVSGGLTMIADQFTSLRMNVRNTQTVLQTFQTALGASWEWHAGRKMLRGMRDIVAAGGEMLDQRALMLAADWKQAEVAQMTATAHRAAASVMAATPASALTAERTLLGIFGNVREAQAGLTVFLRKNAAMTAAGRGAGAKRQVAYGLEALDVQDAFVDRKTGKLIVPAYKAGMHELVTLMLAIPRTLDMNQLMRFMRMAGPAAQAMSWQDYARTYGEAIASMSRTSGRGLQMPYKTFLGGNGSKALADELVRAGPVKPGAIRHIAGLSRDILDYHGIVGWQEPTTNAAGWAHDVLFPTLAKHGFQGVPGMMQAMGSLPVTVQRLLSLLRTDWAQVERGKQTIERADQTDSYDHEAADSWPLNVKSFEATWQRLTQALGEPAAAFALPMLHDLTTDLKALTGPTGPFALATGIAALGKALPSVPKWLTQFASKQAVAVASAKLLRLPGAFGLVMGLGCDTNQRWAPDHPLSKADQERLRKNFIAHHVPILDWLPTFERPHRVDSDLPPPPPPPVNVTLHSPISLPIPPLSETDIESLFRRAIYSHNAALLHELAAAIVRRQRNDLLPVVEDAIRKMQMQRRRATFIDLGYGLA